MQDNEKQKELTPKQQLFIENYLYTFNATRAAIAAGYSEKTARTQGSALLTNPVIQKAIDFELDDLYRKQKQKLTRAADIAIKALIDVVENGKGLAKVHAANSILDRSGHKALDRFQGDLNANVKGDVNVTDTSVKSTLLSKLLLRFNKDGDSNNHSES